MLARALTAASAVVVLLLGCVHLAFTFTGQFGLRDRELQTRLHHTSPNLSGQITVWKAWIGFNASHAMGLILFGLIYGYFALHRPGLLFDSPFLILLGALVLGGYLILAKLYWFSAPLAGVALASTLYVLGIATALSRAAT